MATRKRTSAKKGGKSKKAGRLSARKLGKVVGGGSQNICNPWICVCKLPSAAIMAAKSVL